MVRQLCLLGTYFIKRGKAKVVLGVLLELLTVIVIAAMRADPSDQLETQLQLFHPT